MNNECEWGNFLCLFFQGWLGWSLPATTAFCVGFLIVAILIVSGIGSIKGYVDFSLQKEQMNDLPYAERVNQNITNHIGGLLAVLPALVVIVIAALLATWIMK